MQTLAQIKALLDERGLRPKRSLGQNFLIDHNLIRKLVDASGAHAGDLVLEVGPGTGTMTEELLARGCRVVACELDDGLAALLRDRLPGVPGGENFRLVHGDCLAGKQRLSPDLEWALGHEPFALVSNLPYGAGTPLMATLLIDHPRCHTMAVTVQREVADRVAARPATRDYGALAVIAQALATVERIATAPPECFWPRPEVTSSMLLLRRRADPLTRDPRRLAAFCRRAFAQRRKQLGSVLKGLDWGRLGGTPGLEAVRPGQRAEELSPAQVVALAEIAAETGREG